MTVTSSTTTGEQEQDDWTCSTCDGQLEPINNVSTDKYCPACHHRQVQSVLDASPVDDGDWVWYDGYEWRADHLYETTMLLRRLDPDDPTENIEEWGVSVQRLIPRDAVDCSDCGAFLPGNVDVQYAPFPPISHDPERFELHCGDCGAEISDGWVARALACTVDYRSF